MYDLTALRKATDKILDDAKELPSPAVSFPSNPINWAELRCLEASYVQTDDGRAYHLVVIEAAAPERLEFYKHIEKRLAESGFRDVEVVEEFRAWHDHREDVG